MSNPKFIAFQMIGAVASYGLFVSGVTSARCLAPLAATMLISAVKTFID